MVTTSKILGTYFDRMGDEQFKSGDAFCDYLRVIYDKQLKVVIYTDFDVDGIMSGIVAYAGLSELGFNVDLYKPVPARGYGFRNVDVDAIMALYPDVQVILTGDVGISCNDTIDYAKSKGLIVLVTDHHGSKCECTADVAVNPNQFGETFVHSGICGSYVLYRLLDTYCHRYCTPDVTATIYRLQLFAGIATVSDIMPLLYENRQLVRNSIDLMRYFFNFDSVETIVPPEYSAMYSRAFVGIKNLLDYFKKIRKIKTADDIDETFYGFYLVPFLNSCKRMDGDMNGVYDIFFSPYVHEFENSPGMGCVDNGIRYLADLNDRRKKETDINFAELYERGGVNGVYISNVRAGLKGLLANKLMNTTGIPCFVVSRNPDGSYSGSGRSAAWIMDLAFKHGVRIKTEGHKEAFGITFEDLNAIEEYSDFFDAYVRPRLHDMTAAQENNILKISDVHDNFCDFTADYNTMLEYLNEMHRFHPFGQAFPEPVFDFFVFDKEIAYDFFGRPKQHAKIMIDSGIQISMFYQDEVIY